MASTEVQLAPKFEFTLGSTFTNFVPNASFHNGMSHRQIAKISSQSAAAFSSSSSSSSSSSTTSPTKPQKKLAMQRQSRHTTATKKTLAYGGGMSPSSVARLSPTAPRSPSSEKVDSDSSTDSTTTVSAGSSAGSSSEEVAVVLGVNSVLEQLKDRLQFLENSNHLFFALKAASPSPSPSPSASAAASAEAVDRDFTTPKKADKKKENNPFASQVAYSKQSSNKLDVSFKSGSVAFLEAVDQGFIPACNFYLTIGTDINVRDGKGETALMKAVKKGNIDLINYLIARGADIAAKTFMEACVLHFAASYGQLESAKLLVSKGADIKSKDWSGRTCLHKAAEIGHKPLVEYFSSLFALEDAGNPNPNSPADAKDYIDVVDSLGESPLHFATTFGHSEVVEFLLSQGANPLHLNKSNENVFQKAVRTDNALVLGTLLSHCADKVNINQLHANHKSLLDLAYDCQSISSLKLLIFSGANFENIKQKLEVHELLMLAVVEEAIPLHIDSRIKNMIKTGPVVAALNCMHVNFLYPSLDAITDIMEFF